MLEWAPQRSLRTCVSELVGVALHLQAGSVRGPGGKGSKIASRRAEFKPPFECLNHPCSENSGQVSDSGFNRARTVTAWSTAVGYDSVEPP